MGTDRGELPAPPWGPPGTAGQSLLWCLERLFPSSFSPLCVCRAVSLPLVFRRLFLTPFSLTPHGCAASEVPPSWLLGPAGAGMKQPRPCLMQEPCIPLSAPGLLQPKQHHISPDYLELSILSSGMARDALIFTFLSTFRTYWNNSNTFFWCTTSKL